MSIVDDLQPDPAENEHQDWHRESEEEEIEETDTKVSAAILSRSEGEIDDGYG